jgi:hypothetical protein
MKRLSAAAILLPLSFAVQAQAIKVPKPMRHFTPEQVASVEMPTLSFEETSGITADYDKYFYFHRVDTSFDQAFSDIEECDAAAIGVTLNFYPTFMYGALGSAFGDAVFGSADRRRYRRVNMRNCMGFKGYARYGMERERWQSFNFEEGNGRVEGEKRLGFLMKQAKVASGPMPRGGRLEP